MCDVMVRSCQSTQPHTLATASLQQMQTHKINALPVINDDNEVIGALNMHDLLNAGIV
jgi:arabinose-5-phosphate isomerase